MELYQAGYITVIQGSAIVEGFGTYWLSHVHANDAIAVSGNTGVIQSVDDNHLLMLTAPWPGASSERTRYEISLNPVVETMAELKAKAIKEIDILAGHTRLKYITDAPGQSESYAAKLKDAEAYIAANYHENVDAYKWIKKEAQKTGATPAQVADLIVYTAGIWVEVGSDIESERQAAKLNINLVDDVTGSVSEINAVFEVFKAAMQAL